jgi:hypothetical protein
VGEHDVEFALSNSASPIAKILHDDAQSRMTIVARKRGGFDVGLRDRVLQVKCEAEDAAATER